MTKTQSFAKQELDILAATIPSSIVTPFANEIIALCEAFGKSGQSGSSAPMTASAISQAVNKLLLQQPICDITGHENEWCDIAEINGGEPLWQNNRCSGLFKHKNGDCYYIDAIIFDGDITSRFYSNSGSVTLADGNPIYSKQKIKEFPFTPKTFYIDVIETEWADKTETVKKQGGGWWTSIVKDETQLAEVFKYYKK